MIRWDSGSLNDFRFSWRSRLVSDGNRLGWSGERAGVGCFHGLVGIGLPKSCGEERV